MPNRTVRAQDLQNIEFELVDIGAGKWALGAAIIGGGAGGIGKVDQGSPATDANAWPTRQIGANTQIADTSAAWANNAAAGTAVNIDIALPTPLQADALYLLTVTNPSTESALTVRVKNRETLNAVARYPELTSFAVAASKPDGISILVQGWMLGEAGRLTLSNDTVLGAAGAFTAYVRVRRV